MELINGFFTAMITFFAGLAEIVNKIEWGSIINSILEKIITK